MDLKTPETGFEGLKHILVIEGMGPLGGVVGEGVQA